MSGNIWAPARAVLEAEGRRLRKVRQAAGLTMVELCDAINVRADASLISRIETGCAVPDWIIGERLTAWMDDQTRLQTSHSVDTGAPGLSHPIVTPTPPRATHPDTSRKAMTAVNRENAWAIHNWIIEQLTDHPEGATHEQLWMLYTRLQPEARTSQSGLRTRVSELVRGGIVEDSGRTRTMTTGRQAIVWQLTERPTP